MAVTHAGGGVSNHGIMAPPKNAASGQRRAAAAYSPSQPGSTSTSSSVHKINSPCATAVAALRWRERPRLDTHTGRSGRWPQCRDNTSSVARAAVFGVNHQQLPVDAGRNGQLAETGQGSIERSRAVPCADGNGDVHRSLLHARFSNTDLWDPRNGKLDRLQSQDLLFRGSYWYFSWCTASGACRGRIRLPVGSPTAPIFRPAWRDCIPSSRCGPGSTDGRPGPASGRRPDTPCGSPAHSSRCRRACNIAPGLRRSRQVLA